MNDPAHAMPPHEAPRAVLEGISRVLPWLVGVPALMYLVGWQISMGYYDALGAPWAVGLLSTGQIVAEAKMYVLIFATSAAAGLSALRLGQDPQNARRRSRRLQLITLLMYLLLGATIFIRPLKPWGHAVSHWTFVVLDISIGLLLSDMALSVARDGRRWTSALANLTDWLVWYGLLINPVLVGMTMAGAFPNAGDFMPAASSPLPMVTLRSDAEHTPWVLVGPVGDRLLLARATGDKDSGKKEFRLVGGVEELDIPSHPSVRIF